MLVRITPKPNRNKLELSKQSTIDKEFPLILQLSTLMNVLNKDYDDF